MAKGKPGAYGQRKSQQSTDETPTYNWAAANNNRRRTPANKKPA